ncbi:MAG TPA: hypothetical protein VJJ02_02180 [Candidatus Paceibacterota bacterium]
MGRMFAALLEAAAAGITCVGAGIQYVAGVIEYNAVTKEYKKKFGKELPSPELQKKKAGKPDLRVVKD